MVNTIFILDKTYNTTQILVGDKSSQRMFWNDLYTQEFDTGAETFEFSCYLDENVIEGNYVAFYYNNQYKLFTIMDMEQTHKQGKLVANCYCEIAGLSLLNNYVREFSGDMNCIQFFEHILNDTDWDIGKYSPSLEDTVKTIKVTKLESVWGLIEDYKDIFECELNIRATYENGHITGKYIDIYSDGGLGSPTHKRFEYGRNVTGITKKKELYDWCTGLILDVDCDVSDIIIEEWKGLGFTKGAGDIILNDDANRMYNAGRNHVIGVYEGDETDPTEAIVNAWKQLKERSTPRFDYEVTTALTEDEYEEIHLGDTVYVIDHSYTPPLFLEARVGKLELSFTDRTQNRCILTNYKEIKSKLLDVDYIKLTGTISDIVNSFFPITSDGIADGAITDGKIDSTYFQEITADIVSAGIGVFEDLYAKNMTVINADIENLRAKYADIENLKAGYAEIDHLKADVAEIDTLINGHLTSDNIQSIVITGDKFTVADAFIKDAMIDTINAGKINTGVLNTNNVQIQSEDGSMLLQGNLQQFKDSTGKVRIQIGKDANGEFTFCLFSQDGVGVLLDENGLHSGAIGDGLIVDSMVSENANIQGGKLDINSVVSSINNGTTTINSSKIYLDDEEQSLKVAFNQLKTKVETIEDVTIDGDLSSIIEQVTSNTSNITIMQGEISSLISNTTITKQNGEVVQLKDEYNSTKNTVDSHTTKIGSLETNVNNVTSKQASMELDLNGFRTEVSNTYATKEDFNNLDIGTRNLLKGTSEGRTLTGNNTENQYIWLYDITDPSLLAGKTATLTFKYTLSNWNGEGGIKAQTGYSTYEQFKQEWFRSEGTYTYTSTITFSSTNTDGSLLLRADWLGGKVNVLPKTAILVASDKEANWNLAPEDIQEQFDSIDTSNFVTKTEFNQTNEDFTFKISQSGGGNLIKNSLFKNGTNYWHLWTWDDTYVSSKSMTVKPPYSSYNNHKDYCLEVETSLTSTGVYSRTGCYTSLMPVNPNTTYSFTCYLASHRTNKVFVEVYSDEKGSISHYTGWGIEAEGNSASATNYDGWQYVERTFTTGANTKEIRLHFFMEKCYTNASQAHTVMWLALPCLVEGSTPSKWQPNSDELYDGIVKIDQDGLAVQHGSNKSVLDSQALKFYEGDKPYSRIIGGKFEFTDPNSNKLGYVGYSWWRDAPTKAISSLQATYGHTVALSAPYSQDAGVSVVGVVHSSHDHQVTSDMRLYQGLNLAQPYINGLVNIKPNWSSAVPEHNGVRVASLVLWGTEDATYGRTGYVAGNNALRFGALAGSDIKVGLGIYEDANYNGGVRLALGGPLQMNGWSMMNARSTMDLNAQSRYTKSLLSEGTNEHISYGTLSYSDNEIRWCWKENVFTYQDCDIDPVTDEWVYLDRYICYIELPVFMAENIEADYHINVSKMSWGDWRIREKNQYYFILESEENDFAFTFEVVAKLKDGATIDTNAYVANNSVSEINDEVPRDFENLEIPTNNIQENINTGEE